MSIVYSGNVVRFWTQLPIFPGWLLIPGYHWFEHPKLPIFFLHGEADHRRGGEEGLLGIYSASTGGLISLDCDIKEPENGTGDMAFPSWHRIPTVQLLNPEASCKLKVMRSRAGKTDVGLFEYGVYPISPNYRLEDLRAYTRFSDMPMDCRFLLPTKQPTWPWWILAENFKLLSPAKDASQLFSTLHWTNIDLIIFFSGDYCSNIKRHWNPKSNKLDNYQPTNISCDGHDFFGHWTPD